MCACARYTRGDHLFRAVPGGAPAAGERLLGRSRIPTLAERSPRHVWVESARCGEPAARNEGASGKTSTVNEISFTVRHGPPYVLFFSFLGERDDQRVCCNVLRIRVANERQCRFHHAETKLKSFSKHSRTWWVFFPFWGRGTSKEYAVMSSV